MGDLVIEQVLLDGRGQVHVFEMPALSLRPGLVLVQTAHSLSSSGIELAAIQHQSANCWSLEVRW